MQFSVIQSQINSDKYYSFSNKMQLHFNTRQIVIPTTTKGVIQINFQENESEGKFFKALGASSSKQLTTETKIEKHLVRHIPFLCFNLNNNTFNRIRPLEVLKHFFVNCEISLSEADRLGLDTVRNRNQQDIYQTFSLNSNNSTFYSDRQKCSNI